MNSVPQETRVDVIFDKVERRWTELSWEGWEMRRHAVSI